MSMFVNIISAIGNNSSRYPLLVRDCGIEAPTKVLQTYAQNKKESDIMAKHAARERIIDEYGASLIWLGGIPTVEYLCNKIIDKRGLNSRVNYKLLDDNKNAMSAVDRAQQSVDINIEKFKNVEGAEKAVEDLRKAKLNKNIFKNMTVAKYTAAITIPVALMGFVLPKSNFALTRYFIKKDAEKGLIPQKYLEDKEYLKNNNSKTSNTSITSNTPNTPGASQIQSEKKAAIDYNKLYFGKDPVPTFDTFNKYMNNKSVSFTGFASFMTGLSDQSKMAMTDGGLGIGRVTTSRRKNEAVENGFRMAGMMYLNFVAPKQIDKFLDKAITKTFGINPGLDPKIMANKEFLDKVSSNMLELPKKQEDVIDFIDKNPNSMFAKITAQTEDIKYINIGTKDNPNMIRDPRCFVDTKKVFDLSEKIKAFGKGARMSGNVEKYAKIAKAAKSVSILTNVAVSSALLAFALPQAQFALRKLLFKSDVDPGLV